MAIKTRHPKTGSTTNLRGKDRPHHITGTTIKTHTNIVPAKNNP